jgi:hypothetical protein
MHTKTNKRQFLIENSIKKYIYIFTLESNVTSPWLSGVLVIQQKPYKE